MQIDTGAYAGIIPRNFWEKFGRPQLQKSTKVSRNHDNHRKIFGNLSALIEMKKGFSITDLVVDVDQNFGLLGGDKLEIESVSIHSTTDTIGCLEGYAAKKTQREG